MSSIYKLILDDVITFYIGKSNNIRKRLYTHKSNCYNEKCKDYNMDVYVFLRECGIQKQDFYNRITIVEIYNGIPDQYQKLMEQLAIDHYSVDNILQNTIRANTFNNEYQKEYYEDNKEYKREYYEDNKERHLESMRQKINCEICNEEMNKSSLIRHLKRKHTTTHDVQKQN